MVEMRYVSVNIERGSITGIYVELDKLPSLGRTVTRYGET